ncbi:MAG: hypothetical protein BWY79_01450 [Actinobacteria bacterium ADurb.Bin444]|nr:MAG: hypothetical protein BWY79_01450 [Actinobacteria bacterium ADurb.Bin444]
MAQLAAGGRHLRVGQQHLSGAIQMNAHRHIESAGGGCALAGPVGVEEGGQVGAGVLARVADCAAPGSAAGVAHIERQCTIAGQIADQRLQGDRGEKAGRHAQRRDLAGRAAPVELATVLDLISVCAGFGQIEARRGVGRRFDLLSEMALEFLGTGGRVGSAREGIAVFQPYPAIAPTATTAGSCNSCPPCATHSF